jgi:hypothetical protein
MNTLTEEQMRTLDTIIARRVAWWENKAKGLANKHDADYGLGVAQGMRLAIDLIGRVADGKVSPDELIDR